MNRSCKHPTTWTLRISSYLHNKGMIIPMATTVQTILEKGATAPNFCLPASTGDEICLANYHGKSQVILFFVREYV